MRAVARKSAELHAFVAFTADCPHAAPMQIHWFSIFNSFMMVIFLTGLVSMILLRTLRNDYAKCVPAPRVPALWSSCFESSTLHLSF